MAGITVTRSIKAPVEAVFAYVDDHRNTVKYMQGLTRWEPAGSVTHGKGATFDVAMKAGPLTLGGVMEVTEWKQNSTIGWVSRKGIKQQGRWTFAAKGGGTEATLEADVEFPGGIAGRVAGKAAEPIFRGNLEKSVDTLKAQVEKAAGKRAAGAR
jgi:uncharacterized membrane protein